MFISSFPEYKFSLEVNLNVLCLQVNILVQTIFSRERERERETGRGTVRRKEREREVNNNGKNVITILWTSNLI
jgi:hypothetical protein